MSPFSYPAKVTAGGDGRVMVEFVDLARVASDGKDDREAMEEATWRCAIGVSATPSWLAVWESTSG
jgi:hypothetical protein